MHDAVADVLAQRAALDSGRVAAVALSVALHGGITALAVWSALHTTPPQRVSTVNIRLTAAQRTPQPLTPAPPAQTTPKPPEPPRIEPPKPQPTKPVTSTAPPIKNTAPTSAFGRSTKKPSDVPPPPAQTAPVATAPPIPIGGSGVTALEGGEFPYTLYVEGMQRKIGTFWIGRPQVAPGVAAVVAFRIDRDGTISEAKIITSSGNSTFDRAALSAVRSSSPLNSLPFGYSGTYLGVQLTFR